MHGGGGAFGKFVAWHHNSKCNDIMLSNDKCWETRIQRLFDGLIFVKRGLGMHVQRILENSRGLYTGGNFKQTVWKNRRDIGDLIYDHDLIN